MSLQLSQAVAENLLALDQKFWIRVAARADTADEVSGGRGWGWGGRERERGVEHIKPTPPPPPPSPPPHPFQAGKLQLSSLARAVMQLVEAAVSVTDSQLDAGGAALQRVLAAGADDAGEWRLPLDADALARMRAALADAGAAVDEAFLSSAFAWMRKAAADGNDGVVSLIQTVLQLYAGAALTASPSDDPSDAALNSVLGAPEPEWGAALAGVRAGVGAAAFDAALRRRMEAVALGLPSGSYAQRVQAEYLKEVEARAKDALGGKGQ